MIRVAAFVVESQVFVPRSACPAAGAAPEIIHMVCQAGTQRCPNFIGLEGKYTKCDGAQTLHRLDGQATTSPTPSVQVSVPSNKVEHKDVDINMGDQGKAKGKVKKVNPDGTVEVQTQMPPNSNPTVTNVAQSSMGELRSIYDQYSRMPDVDQLINSVVKVMENAHLPLGQQVTVENELEAAGLDAGKVRSILTTLSQSLTGRPALV